MNKRAVSIVVIVPESDESLKPRQKWIDWLSSLTGQGIQPIVITELGSDLPDDLVNGGICPVQFPLSECICLSAEKRIVTDFAKFLAHLRADLVLVLGQNWTVPQKAAAVAQIPVAIEVSDDLSRTRQLCLVAAQEQSKINLIVRSEGQRKRVIRHLGTLSAPITVCALPSDDSEQEQIDHVTFTTLKDLARQTERTSTTKDFLLQTIMLSPQYAAPALELCQTVRNRQLQTHDNDDFECVELTASLQTSFMPDNEYVSKVAVIFIMTKLVKCICDIAEYQINVTIHSPLNPEVALRQISVPLKSIANQDWTELSFKRLDHVDKCGIIIEFGAPPEVRQRVSLQTLVHKAKRDDRLPALFAK